MSIFSLATNIRLNNHQKTFYGEIINLTFLSISKGFIKKSDIIDVNFLF